MNDSNRGGGGEANSCEGEVRNIRGLLEVPGERLKLGIESQQPVSKGLEERSGGGYVRNGWKQET